MRTARLPSASKGSTLRKRNAREDDRHAEPLREAYGFMQHEERHGQTRRKLGGRQDRGQAGGQAGRTEPKDDMSRT